MHARASAQGFHFSQKYLDIRTAKPARKSMAVMIYKQRFFQTVICMFEIQYQYY